jgi:hypothetical protein
MYSVRLWALQALEGIAESAPQMVLNIYILLIVWNPGTVHTYRGNIILEETHAFCCRLISIHPIPSTSQLAYAGCIMPIPKYPSLVPLKHPLMLNSILTPLLSHLALQHTIIS